MPHSKSDIDRDTGAQIRILYKNRAIIVSDLRKRYLIVGDLHLGFEERFRGAGIAIESKIDKLVTELGDLIEREKVTDLVVNGDVKSGTDRITKSEWDNVPKFFEKMARLCQVSVVPGNHDGGLQHLIPEKVTLLDSNGVLISNILILHGHTRPLPKFERACEQMIMGHLHPIFQRKGSPLSGQPVWVFLKVRRNFIFKESLPRQDETSGSEEVGGNDDIRITLMPSFNLDLVVAGFAVDADRQERKIAPILRDIEGHILEAAVITLEGDLIGDTSLLTSIL